MQAEEAATWVVAHPAPAALALVRSRLPPNDGEGLPLIPSSTGGGARCCVCVCVCGGRGGGGGATSLGTTYSH